MNAYRQRTFQFFRSLLAPLAPVPRLLDFGSGDGWFAQQFQAEGLAAAVTPVEVQPRPHALVQPVVYDGKRLPFDDGSFDLACSVDVLHHCPAPEESLRDVLRCTRGYFLLKDHTYSTSAGWLTLAALDEIGNRRFGVPSNYHYQHGWDWFSVIEGEGFVREHLLHPAACHRGALGWATNRLQFIGLWRRSR
jgi:SAM-dependent methyltransferase